MDYPELIVKKKEKEPLNSIVIESLDQLVEFDKKPGTRLTSIKDNGPDIYVSSSSYLGLGSRALYICGGDLVDFKLISYRGNLYLVGMKK
jgi:hypothetical protein